MYKILLSLLVMLQVAAYAQTGTLKGIASDSTNAEALIGAVVSVVDNNAIGGVTDIDGSFLIENIPAGTYNFKVSYLGYKDRIIEGVSVQAGQVTDLGAFTMVEEGSGYTTVTVIGTRVTSSEEAVLEEVKQSDQVVNAVGAEQISKSQDRDAAQVVRRIPGVTLIDDRFVMVRGLSERYNVVLLNGAIAPSSESETRAFSFDIVPSSMIDRILVYKSGAPDLSGDFAGSVIKLNTRNVLSDNIAALGITLGYRAGTTFNKFVRENASYGDWTTFGNKGREQPSSFPKDLKSLGFDYDEAANQSKRLNDNWGVKSATALPDLRLNLMLGKKFKVGAISFNTINNISYNNTYQYYEATRNRYWNYTADGSSETLLENKDKIYSNGYRLGVLSNWSAVVNRTKATHRFDFRNMYTRMASSDVTERTGSASDKGNDIKFYSLRYGMNAIYSGQLQGTHEFNKERTSITWIGGYSKINKVEPDWKRYTYSRQLHSGNPYALVVPSGPTAQDGARFFTSLEESVYMNSLDLNHQLVKYTDTSALVVKAGYYFEYKNRDYAARWMSYVRGPGFDDQLTTILTAEQLYSGDYTTYPNGLYLQEGTRTSDRYAASNTLTAGYLGLATPFLKYFNIYAGVRIESNRQVLESAVDGTPVKVDNPITSPMPFANLSYNISPKMLVRGGYGKTINRPEFRELSPFSFYDFNIPSDKVGNPKLKVCDIHNLDLRWELYPTAAELVSFGVFYKKFINPIESYIVQGASNVVLIYQNAASAESYGVELELKKSFTFLNAGKFTDHLTFSFNGSLIGSQISLGDNVLSKQKANRAMQGQSPYVINAGFYYSDEDKWQASVLYNIYGKRIYTVGDDQTRTWYEMPRHSLDVSVSRKITNKLEVKLGIVNLLNGTYRIKEDGDDNTHLQDSGKDKDIITYTTGQYVTLGALMKF
jgi:TonB dependent receptor/TonB-dependent Receptor Plug Domain/CarboxypepD_reg-like domain